LPPTGDRPRGNAVTT